MPGRHRHPIRSVQGIPPDIWDDALHLARGEGTTRNAVVVELLTAWVQARRRNAERDAARDAATPRPKRAAP